MELLWWMLEYSLWGIRKLWNFVDFELANWKSCNDIKVFIYLWVFLLTFLLEIKQFSNVKHFWSIELYFVNIASVGFSVKLWIYEIGCSLILIGCWHLKLYGGRERVQYEAGRRTGPIGDLYRYQAQAHKTQLHGCGQKGPWTEKDNWQVWSKPIPHTSDCVLYLHHDIIFILYDLNWFFFFFKVENLNFKYMITNVQD